ncbi:Splicing factor mud2 [Saccharomyces pastorianus]|uniref:Splicing factor mud2 n=1 Tax=Saccharomyces pastorianus TaxID=27292 RepID=A0A6C1ECB4_SACPS|nr:Splicing factor mud2 [Saccharomyces pastorianus]
MTDEKRLEDLRSKIMESIGRSDKDSVGVENKRSNTNNGYIDAHSKRQRSDGKLPTAPKSRDARYSRSNGLQSSAIVNANRSTYDQSRAGPHRQGQRDALGRSYNRENRYNTHGSVPQWNDNSFSRQRDERRGRSERSDRRDRNGNENYGRFGNQRKNDGRKFHDDHEKMQVQTNRHDMNYNAQNVIYPGSAFDSPAYYNMASSKANSRLITKLGDVELDWRRPNEYVQQLDHLVGFCRGTVIALENLENVKEANDDKMKELLASFNIANGASKLLFYNCSLGANNTDKEPEFTKCVLLLFEVVTPDILDKLKPYKWFKPNDGKTSQVTSWITFQSLPNLVTQSVHPESVVLMLLNCLDPLDLKDETFITEVKETLKYTVKGIEVIKICQPGVDYRLNYENLAVGAGNIYIKFKTLEAAKNAMEELPGTQFNDRTVLCTYIDESDFDMMEAIQLP